MKGMCLNLYLYEFQKHHGILLYEWLLEFAKKNNFQGGSAFRAIAGFGQDHVMHEEHFFELASDVPVVVSFFLSKEESTQLLDLIKLEKLKLFYVLTEADFGFTNP